MSALLELEGIMRGQAQLTYGQVGLVFIAGGFAGCALFTMSVVPRLAVWWSPLLALLPSLVWLGGAIWALKMLPAFRSPFRPVEAYRTIGGSN